MNRSLLFIATALLLLLGGSAACSAQPSGPIGGPTPPHPGIDVQHYAFRLTLSDASNRIEGEATVRLQVSSDTVTAVRLDLDNPDGGTGSKGMTVMRVTADGADVPFRQANDHLVLDAGTDFEAGTERTYVIRYSGVPVDGLVIGENQHGGRTFFGDNWPNRARHWLPVVDHPSDKATVEWTVEAPSEYRTVANGKLVSEAVEDGVRTVTYRSPSKLPTKVMVIGVADFAVDSLGVQSDVPMTGWVYPEDRKAGLRDLQAVPRALRFFEANVAPYPFEKLANVQSSTRYGGMENAGAIFYSERAIADGEDSTPLFAHEIAHQWFGNDVTETDWAHLWLSEGVASYLETLYVETIEGTSYLRDMMSARRERSIGFQNQNPDTPLVDTTYTDPNQVLNAQTYYKGAWVLHLLRHRIGDDDLWTTMQTFHDRYKGGNASTGNFQSVAEEVSDEDLSTFFQQWTRRSGYPILNVSWRYDAEAEAVEITVKQEQRGTPFQTPLEVALQIGDTSQLETLDLSSGTQTYTIETPAPVTGIEVDPHTWFFGEWEVSPAAESPSAG